MKNLKIKKLLALAIAGVLSVGLVACGSSDADGAKTDAAAGSYIGRYQERWNH